MPAVAFKPIEVRLALARTPTVGIPSLRVALFKFAELGGDVAGFHAWLLDKHADVDIRTAVWARVRAFGRWQNTHSTLESDRLWKDQLELEQQIIPEACDPQTELFVEAVARLSAAAKCALSADGRFVRFAVALEHERRVARAAQELRGTSGATSLQAGAATVN